MTPARTAALLTIAGGTLLAVAVGFGLSMWAGIGLAGGLIMAAGIQSLRSTRG